jgi:hypothetical protein
VRAGGGHRLLEELREHRGGVAGAVTGGFNGFNMIEGGTS